MNFDITLTIAQALSETVPNGSTSSVRSPSCISVQQFTVQLCAVSFNFHLAQASNFLVI